MIKTFCITIFSLFSYCTIFSQVGGTDQFRDSLKHELAIAKDDTSRVLIMSGLANAYFGFYTDTAKQYGNKALELAKQIHFLRGEAAALIALGNVYQAEGDVPKSVECIYRSIQIADDRNFVFEKAASYTVMANAIWYYSEYTKTVDFATRSQRLFETIIHKPMVSEWMYFNLLTIGQAYLEYDLDSAYAYLLQFYNATMDNKYWHPAALNNLGDCLFRRGDREVAFNYLRAGYAAAIENGDYLTVSEACRTISVFFQTTQQPDSVIFYAGRGLTAAQKIAFGFGIHKNSKFLAETYESLDVHQALHYRKIYDSINENLYGAKKVRDLQKTVTEEQYRQQVILQEQIDRENRLKQYGFITGLSIMLLIAFFLYRNNQQKKKANVVLQIQKEKAESALTKLKAAQALLIQSEKMASLGELTAGIAHEIQNPLNFVNNFSELNKDMVVEASEEIDKGNYGEAKIILNDIKENSEKINHHGKRADAIVKAMLQHSSSSSGVKEQTDINALCAEYLRLSYHAFLSGRQGLRAKDNSFDTIIKTDFDEKIENIQVIPQEIGRVLLNLYNNAFYAVDEKKRITGDSYDPNVSVSTKKTGDKIEITVKDNGKGIPQKIRDKIFQPFFTTKPTGQGTGLGLSLSYDIVKAHGGDLKVETKEGEGSEFIIQLPVI